jgi:hypothetical protein
VTSIEPRPKRWIALAATTAAASAFAPGAAQAHLVSTGMGPVYDGIVHFALSPEALAPVVILALSAGLQGPATARRLMFAAPAAWLAGMGLGALGFSLTGLADSLATAAMFMVAGGLLAAEKRAPASLTLAAGALLGLIRGASDMAALGAGGAAALSMIGTAASVFVLTALAASVALPLQALWLRIAVRYAGSCLAALGLLLAGWAIKLSRAAAG